MFGFKKPNYSCTTIGTITKPSAVKINNMNLPLVEYEVEGQKYTTRVPFELAKEMELKARAAAGYQDNLTDSIRAAKDAIMNQNSGDAKIVRNNLSFGLNFEGQIMFTVGKKVVVNYDPEKPKKAIVTSEYIENQN